MASRLESIPYDVLLQVAFFTASGSVLGPPSSLPNLLLTSKALYRELNVTACPHLYARLFHHQFDAPALFNPTPFGHPASTTLALEYVARHKLLRRSRLSSWSDQDLLGDMRCALRMILESDGTNESQLALDNFPEQLLALAEAHLGPDSGEVGSQELKCLLVWLLSMSLSQRDISRISSERLEHLCLLLLRFTVPASHPSQILWFSELVTFFQCDSVASTSSKKPQCGYLDGHPSSGILSLSHPFSVLQPSFPAINVIFAMKECRPILIPPHLPETRAIALANQFTGPTRQDLREFQRCRTPLFADSIPRDNFSASFTLPGRSRSHDPEWYHLFGREHPGPRLTAPHLRLGAFAGLWKGSMMTEVTQEDATESSGLMNRQPLQVLLKSYHCFSSYTPLLSRSGDGSFNSFPFEPFDDSQTNDFERLLDQHHYLESESVENQEDGATRERPSRRKEPMPPIADTILCGETTDDHDQAWKGFRYVGRVHKDGLVLLKRKPKNQSEEYLGTSLFEGRLLNGGTFVGRWRNSLERQGPRGIFTLVKAKREDSA
ncbi:hypothetical protein CC2G_002060 [Coprinopsis cinerea AmutBmut pab1-1]|nr:hypothetical protein CC2G_002060 [Coprinopsis cinerea AmutBmut pab1-1]